MSDKRRSAIVTGGASGIGAAIAARLTNAGVQVHSFDITDGGKTIQVDVTNEADCRRAVSASEPIDILVNSAGWPARMRRAGRCPMGNLSV